MVSTRGARRVVVATALTVCAFLALLLLFVPVLLVPVGTAGRLLLTFSIPEIGFAAIGVLFLAVLGEDASFVDLDVPNLSDAWFVVSGTLGLVGFNLLVHGLFARAGFETASRFTAPGDVELTFLVVLLSIVFVVIVGPAEEFFFRGVVQRYLAGSLTRRGAYAWTSLLFAVVHLPTVTVAGGGLPQYAMVGGILFVVSWVLCWLYDRTRNLVVPALVHGCYNVLVFVSLVTGLMP